MSKQGTWCDNIIMQAVANAYNCVIHITQSNINSPESTILTPVADQDGRKTIFIGYINELHYVSTLTDKNKTNENRHGRLLKHRNYMKRVKYTETANERASRLEGKRGTYRKTMSEETAEKRKERLKNKRDTYRKRVSEETVDHYQCQRCIRDKQQQKKFSKENDMVPSLVPLQLQGLTQVEEMLIARALPVMRVYIKPGGQRGYSGHCINLPQDIAELAHSLPRYPKDLSVIVVKMKGKENSFKDVTVRRQNVADALQWLVNNNSHYKDITINQNSLNSLPEHGGDPTNPSLRRDIPLGERVKHLLKFGENKNDKWVYRFATHPRFGYWALNMIQRKRILQQTGMFLKQNPGEAHLTAEELRQMATSNNTSMFISKISRYLSNITGSNAYWHKAKEDLKAIIAHAGAPTHSFSHSPLLICIGLNFMQFLVTQSVIIQLSTNGRIGTGTDLNIKLEVVYIVMV
ncbi:unnamed protein product [Porites lobata]|uniref:OTU domain-containing protein n=1 Tax=Porites lobata TaxID=104759 RepID=A0ABN8P898_9CNID|nr:unnamed protein product [Porites lobata]